MGATGIGLVIPVVIGLYLPFCAPAIVQTVPDAPVAPVLWTDPIDLPARDVFHGPWGAAHAPAPDVVYTFVNLKEGGTNPGFIARDPSGREWNVKQISRNERGNEAPVEVVVSRLLSTVGYRQPPVYYLRSLYLRDAFGTRVVDGGRFRLRVASLRDRGPWSWHRNPHAGTQAFNGLLAILALLGSSDLKNSNNSLYEYRGGDLLEQWYVVRDLGAGLGETGKLAPFRNNVDLFEQRGFIRGVRDRFVVFDYNGFHQELVRDRITVDDVRWAAALLARLRDRQWADAFRAGGYDATTAARFIGKLRAGIEQGLRLERR